MTLPNLEEKVMNCNKCGDQLGSFAITTQKHFFPPQFKIELPVRYKCQCSCGGESFIFKSEYKCFFLPTDEKLYDGMAQDGNLFTVKVR